jgi:hypothetical protein
MSDIPQCPKFVRGHGCPRSDVVLLSEDDAGGTVYSFGCRTCRTGFAVSKGSTVARARLANAIAREKSLIPTAHDRAHFMAPRGGWK